MRQFLLNWCANCYNSFKNKGIAMFLCTQCCELKVVCTSLYFLADFNNSHIILTRIISWFWFYVQKLNLTTAARLASFSNYKTRIGSCSINFYQISRIFTSFWWELSHSQIWSSFRNQNWNIVGQMATILVCVIEFPRQNWAGRMTHRVISSVGPYFHRQWYIKKHFTDGHGRYDLERGDTLEKSKLY